MWGSYKSLPKTADVGEDDQNLNLKNYADAGDMFAKINSDLHNILSKYQT